MANFLFCQTSTSADAANGFGKWRMANFLFCQTSTSADAANGFANDIWLSFGFIPVITAALRLTTPSKAVPGPPFNNDGGYGARCSNSLVRPHICHDRVRNAVNPMPIVER